MCLALQMAGSPCGAGPLPGSMHGRAALTPVTEMLLSRRSSMLYGSKGISL